MNGVPFLIGFDCVFQCERCETIKKRFSNMIQNESKRINMNNND